MAAMKRLWLISERPYVHKLIDRKTEENNETGGEQKYTRKHRTPQQQQGLSNLLGSIVKFKYMARIKYFLIKDLLFFWKGKISTPFCVWWFTPKV